MNTLPYVVPWAASIGGALLIGMALRLWETRPSAGQAWRYGVLISFLLMLLPSFAFAQQDLQASVQAGNAVIMYLSGSLAAVGIVSSGIAMMMGRHSIAKWAFAGAMVSGLAFAIVRTMWTDFGLTPPDVAGGF